MMCFQGLMGVTSLDELTEHMIVRHPYPLPGLARRLVCLMLTEVGPSFCAGR